MNHYYLFVTDDRDNTFLYTFETLEEAQEKMDDLHDSGPCECRIIEGVEVT